MRLCKPSGLPRSFTVFSRKATDNAGNVGQASTSFTVAATVAGLSILTAQFVESSPRFASAKPAERAAVRLLLQISGQVLQQIEPKLNAKQKAALVGAYEKDISALVPAGWLTPAEVTVLDTTAGAL